jgi:hypothetical protein
MKRFYIFSIILFISTAWLYGQQNRLQVSIKALPQSQADWEMTLNWESGIALNGGILFQLPAGINMVPLSIQLDGAELWLLKGNSVPQQDSVVVWQVTPQGLILLFKSNLVKAGDGMLIRCQAQISNGLPEGSTVQVKEVTNQNGNLRLLEQSMASANIPSIPQKEEN